MELTLRFPSTPDGDQRAHLLLDVLAHTARNPARLAALRAYLASPALALPTTWRRLPADVPPDGMLALVLMGTPERPLPSPAMLRWDGPAGEWRVPPACKAPIHGPSFPDWLPLPQEVLAMAAEGPTAPRDVRAALDVLKAAAAEPPGSYVRCAELDPAPAWAVWREADNPSCYRAVRELLFPRADLDTSRGPFGATRLDLALEGPLRGEDKWHGTVDVVVGVGAVDVCLRTFTLLGADPSDVIAKAVEQFDAGGGFDLAACNAAMRAARLSEGPSPLGIPPTAAPKGIGGEGALAELEARCARLEAELAALKAAGATQTIAKVIQAGGDPPEVLLETSREGAQAFGRCMGQWVRIAAFPAAEEG